MLRVSSVIDWKYLYFPNFPLFFKSLRVEKYIYVSVSQRGQAAAGKAGLCWVSMKKDAPWGEQPVACSDEETPPSWKSSSVSERAQNKLIQRCESCWTEQDPLAFRLQAAHSLWEMPYVAFTMHQADPASRGMMSSSVPGQRQKTPNHQDLCLTLFMVCFSQVPLKQPPSWSHRHTCAWVPAWEKRAPDLGRPDWSPGVADTLWKLQTLIFTLA